MIGNWVIRVEKGKKKDVTIVSTNDLDSTYRVCFDGGNMDSVVLHHGIPEVVTELYKSSCADVAVYEKRIRIYVDAGGAPGPVEVSGTYEFIR